jgi:Pyruvate/2-oxoacid:ferredoxin oxidoreductase delta subunit
MNQLTRARFLRGDWQKPPVLPSVDAVARISPACLAYRSVLCRSCADTCIPNAIVIDTAASSVAFPCIDQDLCNGCGDCRRSCPAQAIELVERNREGESN